MTKMDIFSNSLPPDLEQPLTVLRDRLRAGQRPLSDWSGGEMAVSAVPGA